MDSSVTRVVEGDVDSDVVVTVTEPVLQDGTNSNTGGNVVIIDQSGTETVLYLMPSQDSANLSAVNYTTEDGTVVSLADSQVGNEEMIILKSEVDCQADVPGPDATSIAKGTDSVEVESKDTLSNNYDEDIADKEVTIVMFCEYCGENLDTLQELNNHMLLVHGIKEELTVEDSGSEPCTSTVGDLDQEVFSNQQELEMHAKNCDLVKDDVESDGLEVLKSNVGRLIPAGEIISKTGPDSKLLHKCQFCNMRFSVRSQLDTHIEEGHASDDFKEETYYKCPYCSNSFLTKWGKTAVLHHIKKKHPGKHNVHLETLGKDHQFVKVENNATNLLYNCPYCAKAFRWQKSITKHVKTAHADVCLDLSGDDIRKLTGARWKRRSLKAERIVITEDSADLDLEKHVSSVYSCELCPRKFLWKKSLVAHCKLAHKIKSDDVRSESTLHSADVLELNSEIDASSIHLCTLCPKKFLWKKSLASHCKTVHGIKLDDMPLESTVISEDSSEMNPETDTSSVYGKPPISHSKADHEIKLDDVSSESIFISENTSELNREKDTGPVLICKLCRKKFLYKKSLISHCKTEHKMEIVDVSAERALVAEDLSELDLTKDVSTVYLCTLCPKKFRWKKSAIAHGKLVHNIKLDNIPSETKIISEDTSELDPEEDASPVYLCKLCPKKYLWRKSLKAHYKADHGVKLRDMSSESNRVRPKGNLFYKCPFCSLVTRYASSIKKHIGLKHLEQCDNGVVPSTDELPIVEDQKSVSVKVLDKRPPEERYEEWSVVYKCPLCDFATNNQTNLQRHLVSKKHGNIFTDEDIKRVKLASFRVKKGDDPDGAEVERRAKYGLMTLQTIASEKQQNIKFIDGIVSVQRDLQEATSQLKSNVTKSNNAIRDSTSNSHSDDENVNPVTSETSAYEKVIEDTKDIGHGKEIERKHECPYCINRVDSMETLRLHIARHHPDCVIVIKTEFMESGSFEQNKVGLETDSNTAILSYKCTLCGDLFEELNIFLNHVKGSHDRKLKTQECNNVEAATRRSGRKRKAKCFDNYEITLPKLPKKADKRQSPKQIKSSPKVGNMPDAQINDRKESAIATKDSDAYQCSHCDFSCKRVSALKFHINFCHSDTKMDKPAISSQTKNSDKSPKRAHVPPTSSGVADKMKAGKISARSITGVSGDQNEELVLEMEIDEEIEDDRDSDYEPDVSDSNSDDANEDDDGIGENSDVRCSNDKDKCQKFKYNDKKFVLKRINKHHAKSHTKSGNIPVPVVLRAEKNNENDDPTVLEESHTKYSARNTDGKKPAVASNSTKMMRFKCSYCNFGSQYKSSVIRHNKIWHAGDDSIDINSFECIEETGNYFAVEKHDSLGQSLGQKSSKELDTSNSFGDLDISKNAVSVNGSFDDKINSDASDFGDSDDDFDSDIDNTSHDAGEGTVNLTQAVKREFKCPFCEFKTKYKSCVTNHVERCHPEEKDFDEENIEFVEEFGLMDNLAVGNNLVNYKCPHCSMTSLYKKSVERHIQRYHSHLEEADVISLSSEDAAKDNLKAKVKVGDRKAKYFQCPYCAFVCESKQGVRIHALANHPEKPTLKKEDIKSLDIGSIPLRSKYKCPYCPMTSPVENIVVTHVKSKHPEHPEFNLEDLVIQSVIEDGTALMEENKDPGSNDVGFDADAGQLDDLETEEMNEDLGTDGTIKFLRRYKCPYCDQKSQYKKSIERHVRRWHADQNDFDIDNIEYFGEVVNDVVKKEESNLLYKCMYCDFVCQSKIGIRQHASVRHPKQPLMSSEEIVVIDISMCKVQNIYRCPYCTLSSTWKSCIGRHIEKKHPNRKAVKLDDIFSEMELVDARSEKDNPNCYKCPYCHFHSKAKRGIIVHVQAAHPTEQVPSKFVVIQGSSNKKMINVFKCPLCIFSSKWRSVINRHMKVHHADENLRSEDILCVQELPKSKQQQTGIYSCPYCGIINKWKKSIVKHIKVHHPNKSEKVYLKSKATDDVPLSRLPRKIIECMHCDFWCRIMRGMGVHLDRQHPGVGGINNTDNFRFVYQDTNSTVPEGRDPEDPLYNYKYKCHICNINYDWKKSLVFHMRTRHGDMYDAFKALEQIVDIVHNNQPGGSGSMLKYQPGERRRFACTYCSMAFQMRKDLEMHLTSQHADKIDSSQTLEDLMKILIRNGDDQMVSSSITCVKCKVKFNSEESLRRHHKMKHKFSNRFSSLRHVCRSCGSWFSDHMALLRHKLCHHRGRGVRCGQCGQLFSSVYSLGVHQQVVHRSKQLVCKYADCKFRCRFRTSMKVHYNRHRGSQSDMISPGEPSADPLSNDKHTCEICLIDFDSGANLLKHITSRHNKIDCGGRRSPRKKMFHCKVCSMVFNLQSWRDKHMEEAHPAHVEMCDVCGMLFASEKQMKLHIRRRHDYSALSSECQADQKYVACEHCNQMIMRKNIRNHHVAHHPQTLVCTCKICSDPNSSESMDKCFTCELCKKRFCQKFYLKAHMNTCHSAKKNRCKFCGQAFSNVLDRNQHIHEEHKSAVTEAAVAALGGGAEPLLLEDTADPETQVLHIGQDQSQQYLPKLNDGSLNAVIKELQIISTDKSCKLPYKCMLCGRCFGKPKYIQLHIRRKHVRDEDQPYRCKVCGSGFIRLADFRKHSRAHSGFRPYKCKFCSKAFKQSANLLEHMRIHSDSRDFRCEICKQTFQQHGALKAHVSRHDTLKPFTCMFCDKGFSTRGELSRHLQRYDGKANKSKDKRTHICHICQETFSHFPMLVKHIEMHNPEKPFHCQACDAKFISYVSMYNHKVKESHFLKSEILFESEEELKATRAGKSVNKDLNDAVSSIAKDDSQIFIKNQSEDPTQIEVDMDPFQSDGLMSTSVQKTENDELWSIAKQLTELSGYTQYYEGQDPEHEAMMEKEDEIMKGMLDADTDLLANINKQSTVTKWPKQHWSDNKNDPTLQEKEDPVTEYVAEQELSGSPSVKTGNPLPTSFEDLAALIARNATTDDPLTAYQSEDGSVIYVCMPDQGIETNGEEVQSQEFIEIQGVVEHDPAASNEVSEEMYEVTSSGQDNIQEHSITVISEQVTFAEEHAGVPVEDVASVEKDNPAITVISSVSPEETEVLQAAQEYQHTKGTTVEYIEITAREDTEAVAEEQQLKTADTEEMYADSDVYDEKINEVVEYKSDEKTFIKEELVDSDYSKLVVDNMPLIDEMYYPKEKIYRCSKCQAVCKTKKRLRDHFRRHADMKDRQFGCPKCEKRFCTRTELKRHIVTHTGERNYQCTVCSNRFLQPGHLYDHMKLHQGIKDIACSNCDMTFRTRSQMKCHWARIHGQSQFQCEHCDKMFTTRQGLVTHQGFHHSAVFSKQEDTDAKKPFQCHECGKSFSKKDKLVSHLYRHKSVGKFICEICGGGYNSMTILQNHIKARHSETRNEMCQYCVETFKTRDSLNRHIRCVHQMSKGRKTTIECPVCKKTFKTTGALAYHAGASKNCQQMGAGLLKTESSIGIQVIDVQNA